MVSAYAVYFSNIITDSVLFVKYQLRIFTVKSSSAQQSCTLDLQTKIWYDTDISIQVYN